MPKLKNSNETFWVIVKQCVFVQFLHCSIVFSRDLLKVSILVFHGFFFTISGLSRLNGGEETFLLVTAALANLTFMSPLSSAAMKRCGTPEALVKAVKRSPFTTLFAKDQVVTVLANMAANANCRHDIEAIDGVGFLLSMLETSLNGTNSKSELSAAERVQKKSAIALSRYFDNSNFAKKMLKIIRLKKS